MRPHESNNFLGIICHVLTPSICNLVAGGFAGNCSVGINPAVVGRGKPGEPEAERVWLLSLLPLNDAHGFRDNGNWGKDVTPEDWGATAAESLEKIILRCLLKIPQPDPLAH